MRKKMRKISLVVAAFLAFTTLSCRPESNEIAPQLTSANWEEVTKKLEKLDKTAAKAFADAEKRMQ
jgi:hypothetical protein